ncbi:hypothetical protein NLX83_39640 [Allokutzneria sp. A3M-2-11 16]|uniref:hypothetical protein n=1 Tax=Allokutzneria sp. A3M-2-11 16 TaxID=2962043 RepID=UPI0020B8FC47|nr:hypothetical protein [Allokutzneria sp. A3M-2-11 16]MCP3805398.1 hypothetical protein [Allokutzneria sp. A3M-2-11 16]
MNITLDLTDLLRTRPHTTAQPSAALLLPVVDHRGRPVDLGRFGITVGEPMPGNPLLRRADLPTGWLAMAQDDPLGPGAVVLDEHQRPRLTAHTHADVSRAPFLYVVSLTQYIDHAAADNHMPTLDEKWATAEGVIRRACLLRVLAEAKAANHSCGFDSCAARAGYRRQARRYNLLAERVRDASQTSDATAAADGTVTNTSSLSASTLLGRIVASVGDPSRFIEDMEATGQREFVASTVLPTEVHGGPQVLTDLGVSLGEIVDGDPLFRHVTLPDGWTRRATEHPMWSEIIDSNGHPRISVFYKAAFYDRRAFARIATETDGGDR